MVNTSLTPALNIPLAELRGITLPDVALAVLKDSKCLASRRGSLLFAHFGLSGPVALDVSRVVSGHPQPQALVLEVDVLPAVALGLFTALTMRETALLRTSWRLFPSVTRLGPRSMSI